MNSVCETKKKSKGESLLGRVLSVLLLIALTVSVAFSMVGAPSYGAGRLDMVQTDGFSLIQDKKDALIAFEITNEGSESVEYYPVLTGDGDIRVTAGNGSSSVLTTLSRQGDKATHTFKVDVARLADEGLHSLSLALRDRDGKEITSKSFSVDVWQNLNTQSGGKNAAVDVNYTLSDSSGIVGGADNTLNLEIFNRGGTEIKNAQVSLGLPEGISVNNASGSVNAGYIDIGSTFKTRFPITADASMKSKNYPVVVKVSGVDSSNGAVSLEQTLYIPVKGTGGQFSASEVEINNISLPQQVAGGQDFILSFDILNKGKGKLADTKVTVEVPEGIANKTKNIFIVTGLEPGKSRSCAVTLFSPNKGDSKYQTIKITAAPAEGDSTASVSQFAGTMIKNAGGTEKTPQLMVSNYTYGGSHVQAGDDFSLTLGLYNASAAQDLYNVKVTINSEDGTFIPVNSSNSFYIDRIDARKTVSHAISLSAKRDAEQKTTSITVDMSYEDAAGTAFTAKDVISIPVMQETRLVVDDITAPPELYPGMQSAVSVNFYNMGKTVLNNLRVNVQGDFDTPQSNLYYVGNMEKGKSDSYDFSFIPKETGALSGVITFTYEDADGMERTYEKRFEFNVMEMPVMDDPGMMEPPQDPKKVPWVPVSIGAAVVAAGIGVAIWRKRRKKKLDQEMELDE